MFQALYQSVPAFMISCLKAASGKVLLWVMEQVSLAFRLLSFWLVLTDEKAGSDSPAASQQAWEGVPPQAHPCLLPGDSKTLHIWHGQLVKIYIFPFRRIISQINNAWELLASQQYIHVLWRDMSGHICISLAFTKLRVMGHLALLTQAVNKSLALTVVL